MRQDLQYTILQGKALLAELGENLLKSFGVGFWDGDNAQGAALTRMCCGGVTCLSNVGILGSVSTCKRLKLSWSQLTMCCVA